MSKIMKIEGGINTSYGYEDNFRHCGGKPPKGRKVSYLNKNGYDGDREYANEFFKEGQVLTVKEIYVGSWSSDVEFIEYPNERFNTVMFEDVEEG